MTVRTALLGSAFDPLHFAHVALALLTLGEGHADEVWLCPSPERWDKSPIAPVQHRVRWATLAANHLKNLGFAVEANTIEINEPTYRGTYFLLKKLEKLHPERSFLLIAGEDAVAQMPLWRDPVAGVINGPQLLMETQILLAPRAYPQDTKTEQTPTSMPKTSMPKTSMPKTNAHLPEGGRITRLPEFSSRTDFLQRFLETAGLEKMASSALRKALKNPQSSTGLRFCWAEIEADVRDTNPYGEPSGN